MPGTCSICGKQRVERELSHGGYVGACKYCYQSNPLDITPHVETCDRDDCMVCRDYREEFGSAP